MSTKDWYVLGHTLGFFHVPVSAQWPLKWSRVDCVSLKVCSWAHNCFLVLLTLFSLSILYYYFLKTIIYLFLIQTLHFKLIEQIEKCLQTAPIMFYPRRNAVFNQLSQLASFPLLLVMVTLLLVIAKQTSRVKQIGGVPMPCPPWLHWIGARGHK